MNSVPTLSDDVAGRELRIIARSREIFDRTHDLVMRRTDRLFGWLMLAQWVFAIVLALTVSPRAWTGSASSVHLHVYTAVGLGGLVSLLPWVMMKVRLGKFETRIVIGCAQMLWSALLVPPHGRAHRDALSRLRLPRDPGLLSRSAGAVCGNGRGRCRTFRARPLLARVRVRHHESRMVAIP